MGAGHASVSRFAVTASAVGSVMASSFAIRESAALPHIYPFLSPDLQLWRVLTHFFFFPSAVEAAFGMLLFYKLRAVERRIGSPAYATFLLMSMLLATLMQIALQTVVASGCRAGPYALLVAGLALDVAWVPAAPRVNVFGFPVTDRIIIAFIYVQLLLQGFLGWEDMWIHVVCGLVPGIAFAKNIAGLGKVRLPDRVTKAYYDFCKALGLATYPPAAIEVFTNQVHRPTQPAHANAMLDAGNAAVPEQLLAARRHQMAQAFQNAQRAAVQAVVAATEENIRELEEMGFSRDQARAALEQSGNSLQLATARLLGD